MSRTLSPSVRRPCDLSRTCRLWRVSRSTLHRHRRSDPPRERRLHGPRGPVSGAALAGRIRETLADSPFHGKRYRKIWARLQFSGLRTSPRRVLRVMRENSLLVHQRAGSPRGPRAHDGKITTERVDQM